MRRFFPMLVLAIAAVSSSIASAQSVLKPVGVAPMSHRSIVFVLTSHARKGDAPSGWYLSEASHPHKVLTDAGWQVQFISPQGGQPPLDPDSLNLDDPTNAAFWNNPEIRSALRNTRTPAQVNAADYAAIFFVGGHGTMWDFPDNTALAELTAAIYEQGGVVAAVCHGPAALVNVKLSDGSWLVQGKDVAAFTNEEERAVGLHDTVPFLLADALEQRGARHLPAPRFTPQVITSERLVTGQNPQSATGVGQAMLRLLLSL